MNEKYYEYLYVLRIRLVEYKIIKQKYIKSGIDILR